MLLNIVKLWTTLTLIWAGFLGIGFEVYSAGGGGEGVKLPLMSKTC